MELLCLKWSKDLVEELVVHTSPVDRTESRRTHMVELQGATRMEVVVRNSPLEEARIGHTINNRQDLLGEVAHPPTAAHHMVRLRTHILPGNLTLHLRPIIRPALQLSILTWPLNPVSGLVHTRLSQGDGGLSNPLIHIPRSNLSYSTIPISTPT